MPSALHASYQRHHPLHRNASIRASCGGSLADTFMDLAELRP